MTTHTYTFPAGFRWGAATSSYQIEGAVNEDGRSPSIWDTFCAQSGKIKDGSDGAVACDHYHRWRDDVELLKRLGVNAYRFSIAWPRILPDGTGRVNQAGLDFYSRLVDALLEHGITPFPTLYHWDMPQAQHDKTAWSDRGVVDAFVEYTDVVSRHLGDRVKHWMTLNEPWVISYLGYGVGEHAPGHHSMPEFLRASHNVLLAHGKAVPVLRANVGADAKIGIVLNLTWSDPASSSPEDQRAARMYDGFFNRWFLDPLFKGCYPSDMLDAYLNPDLGIQQGDFEAIQAPTDFMGINYYTRAVMKHDGDSLLGIEGVRQEGEHTEMDWEVYPTGLYNLLKMVHENYRVPSLYITENGAAFADTMSDDRQVHDPRRTAYLQGHFAAMHRAIQEGVPLHGYFVWSLMDNFEWALGYTKRFGIVYVDYETQQRTLKDSALWYANVTRENGFSL